MQCSILNNDIKKLVQELNSKYDINYQTILPIINSYRSTYNKDATYTPTVNEMINFLKERNSIFSPEPNGSGEKISKKNEDSKSKSTVLYEDEEITKAKNKAKREYSIISSSQLGANSAWRIAGENYGIENINMSNAAVYDDLSSDEKSALEQPYRDAVKELKKNRVDINGNKNAATLKAGKLARLAYTQVNDSDGVFIISELVDPGKTPKSYSEQNKASFAVPSGALNAVATYHAMQQHKPIHVYDEYRDGWMTYNYNTSSWEKEGTPTLTKKPLTLGRVGSKEGRGFNETIGEKNWKAIRDVMSKTFRWEAEYYVDKNSKGLSDADMSKTWQNTKKQAEQYSLNTQGIKIDATNHMAKLTQAMNPMERYHRTQYLAREFSRIVDSLIEEDKKTIEDKIVEAKTKLKDSSLDNSQLNAWKRILASEEKYQKILNSQNDTRIRQAVIKRHGLSNTKVAEENYGILDILKSQIKQAIEDSKEDANKAKWQAILDNFDALMTDAFDTVQYLENFRLIPYTQKKSSKVTANVFTDSTMNQTEVDDEGNNMEGNTGWSYKVRFVDPRQSLSQITKRALNSILMRDEKGSLQFDDLGIPSYVNGEYAHAVLINELSDMIDADDFCKRVDDKNGIKYEFPALEKVAIKYPWVQGLIKSLKRDNRLVGAFFHDFNKAFINYYSCDINGKPLPLNSAIAEQAAYNSLKTNYEEGITLTNTSIYSKGGMQKEKAQTLLTKLNDLTTRINNLKEDKEYIESMEAKGRKKQAKDQKNSLLSSLGNISKDLTFILKSLGFNADEFYIKNNLYLLLSKEGKGNKILYTKLADNIKTILTAVSQESEVRGKNKVKVKEDDNYLIDFQGQLKNICKIVGKVTETDNIQSFRDGNNTRYSYSAVNYAINMVKKLKSNERRDEYLKNEFQYDDWFYHNGEWQNSILEALSGEDSTAQYLRDNLSLCEVISMKNPRKNADPISYADWDKQQTYLVMLGQFFSRFSNDEGVQLANYNFPIFSDSPTSMYITLRRYVSSAKEGTYKQQMLPLFNKLIKQEIRRIKMTIDRRNARNDDSITDKTALENIQGLDTNGDKFQFFPELNTYIDSKTGKTFRNAIIEYSKSGDLNSIDKLIERTLIGNGQQEGLMDSLFKDFMQDLGMEEDSLVDMLHSLGVIKTINVSQYAKDNNVSSKEAEATIKNKYIEEAHNALENYFWNSVYATSQIIQLTTTDLAYYKNTVDFFKRFKEVYAAGNRLNTNTKYGRKIENTIYISDHIVTSSKYTLVKKSLDTAVTQGRMNANERDIILEGMENINAADAQAFRNPYSFRAVLDMMGAWSDEMEECFNNILNGTYNSKDFAVVWQTIKPFVFTNVPTNNGLGGRIRVPHQHKNSEYLSLAFYDLVALGSSSNMTLKDSAWLTGLGKFFNDHKEIDSVQFESAVKAGGQGIIDLSYNNDKVDEKLEQYQERAQKVMSEKDFNNSNNMEKLKAALDDILEKNEISQDDYNKILEETSPSQDDLYDYLSEVIKDPETQQFNINNDTTGGTFNSAVVHQIRYEDYMIAQPNPPHFMDQDNATSGSQFRNLILANLPANFTCTINVKGKDVTLNREQIRNLYRGAIVNNLLDAFEDLRDNTFSDIHSLQKMLLSTIQGNPKYGTDIIDALQIIIIEDPLNPGKTIETFNMPLDLPTVSNQIQELVLATFKNHITKQTIKGGSFVQVANVGLTKKLNIERNEDGSIKYAECMMPAWSEKFFKYYMTQDDKGNSYLDISKVPDDLKKMVGYRIPTENKYSMLPLKVVGFLPAEQGGAIMLPADITYLAGSDFDVDKMFLRIPAFEEVTDSSGKKSLQKINYNIQDTLPGEEWKNTSKGEMTKLQRDNMMIDLEYAILTSQVGSEQVSKPGNFDTVKKWGKISRIIENPTLRKSFIRKYGNLVGINTRDEEEIERQDKASTILKILHHKNNKKQETISLKEVQKFIENGQQMNALLPQTYNYMHTQNMVGKSLVGVYANGSSIHTKMQETNLSIDDAHAFYIKDHSGQSRKIQSLHEQTTTIANVISYIQENIAQLQAASVDNAKDPTLADLYQSMFTSGLALIMVRAGMSLEELSYFFGAKKAMDEAGLKVKNKNINNLYSHIEVLDNNNSEKENLEVSVEEVLDTTLYIEKYPELISTLLNTKSNAKDEILDSELYSFLNTYKEQKNLNDNEITNILKTVYHTFKVLNNLEVLKSKLKPANDIMKCDSTNNALAVSLPEAILQKFEVERVNALMETKSFPFIGEEDSSVANEFIQNQVVSSINTREEMEQRFMKTRLPHIQAFHSLGIELPVNMMKEYFIQGNSELQEALFKLLRDSPDNFFAATGNGKMGGTRTVNSFFRGYIQYILSDTEEFGSKDSKDFNVKRMYYLEKFAQDYMKMKKEKNSIITGNNTLSRITITRPNGENNKTPQLILPKSGKQSPLMKASIRRDLDMLLYSSDPKAVELGINLFKYCYYNNGFNYGPNSFASYFDSAYWNAMPEIITKLRTFKYKNSAIKTSINNFIEMFIANHANDTSSILSTYDPNQRTLKYNENGTITVERSGVYSYMTKCAKTYIRVPDTTHNCYIAYKLVKDNYKEKTAIYKPMTIFDEPKAVYNANSSTSKMKELYFNDRSAKMKAKLEAIQKENSKQSNLSSTDTGSMELAEEGISQADAIIQNSSEDSDSAIEETTDIINSLVNDSSAEGIDNEEVESIVKKEAEFMETTTANSNIIESTINSNSPLSEEQSPKIQQVINESAKILEGINRC